MFQQLQLRGLTLPGRILRAATFENMAEPDGKPGKGHAALYVRLALGGAGTIITGFAYTSLQGRAAQRFQAGIDAEDKVEAWKRVIGRVKQANPETKIILQMAHTGRQTISAVTGRPVVGAGPVRCTYFLSTVRTLTEPEAAAIVREFGRAVARAARAGFDAVQIHAAHGYLIHQFLSPHTNRRKDRYGDDPLLFLKEVLTELVRELDRHSVRLQCEGGNFQLKAFRMDLEQLLRQLLHNAIEASENREHPQVLVRLRDQGEHLQVEVRDNGTGIKEEIRERIFEPFFTTKPVGRGLGLGLSIASQIARLHKGSLVLDSSSSEGSCFVLRLPRSLEAE